MAMLNNQRLATTNAGQSTPVQVVCLWTLRSSRTSGAPRRCRHCLGPLGIFGLWGFAMGWIGMIESTIGIAINHLRWSMLYHRRLFWGSHFTDERVERLRCTSVVSVLVSLPELRSNDDCFPSVKPVELTPCLWSPMPACHVPNPHMPEWSHSAYWSQTDLNGTFIREPNIGLYRIVIYIYIAETSRNTMVLIM